MLFFAAVITNGLPPHSQVSAERAVCVRKYTRAWASGKGPHIYVRVAERRADRRLCGVWALLTTMPQALTEAKSSARATGAALNEHAELSCGRVSSSSTACESCGGWLGCGALARELDGVRMARTT